MSERDTPKPFREVTEEEFLAGQAISYQTLSGQTATARYYAHGRGGGFPGLSCGLAYLDLFLPGRSHRRVVSRPIMGIDGARTFFMNLGREVK